MTKSLVIAFLKYAVGLGLLAFVIWKYWHLEDPQSPGQDVGLATLGQRTFHWLPLLLAWLCFNLAALITCVRWWILVRSQDLPFTLENAVRLGLVGVYLNTFLPGSVGGDLFKAYFIAREQERRTVAVLTVFMDRVLGLTALFTMFALLGLIFWTTGLLQTLFLPEAQKALMVIIPLAGALAGGAYLFFSVLHLLPQTWFDRVKGWLGKIPKVGPILAELCDGVWLYRRRSLVLGATILISMVSHFGFVLAYYFASHVLTPADEVPSLAAHCLLVPAGLTVQSGLPLPGGVGGSEFVFAVLYGYAGVPGVTGILTRLTVRVLEWLLALVGYVFFLKLKIVLPKRQGPDHAAAGRDSPEPVPSEAEA